MKIITRSHAFINRFTDITLVRILPIYLISGIILNTCIEKCPRHQLWCSASNSHISIVSQPVNFWEVNMGKYIGYILCILVILFAIEYFQIVDIPYFDIPDIQTTGKVYKEKSEENMRRRFGD